jgi:two-component SAPR family response regulator
MPAMSGFEFVRQVMPLLPKAKIIFMTAFEVNKSEFAIVHPSINADGFITKPFSIKQLCNLIEKQLATSSSG